MTDIYSGGFFREVLLDGAGSLATGGLFREVLISSTTGNTRLEMGGLFREVLISTGGHERRRQCVPVNY